MDTNIQATLNSMNYTTSQLQAAQSKANMGSGKIDKESFLRLLTEQLKNQDPLKPMDNSQMIAQQAQLAQVEAMENMSSALTASASMSQANSLIDKYVYINNPDFDSSKDISDSNPLYIDSGKVTSANFYSGKSYVEVGGTVYEIDQIGRVESNVSTATEE